MRVFLTETAFWGELSSWIVVTVGAFLVALVLSELPLRSRSTLTRRLSRPGVLDRERVRGSDTSCGFG